ncbi:Branchpoint-bridging protein (Splicing factor 1) (Zinc finger protein bpb1) [Durusdinium trenchii]|uniref:Branchpoint-bridging protein (Splicing factor 1) (Zinc finger protein bpb1) n=1 Tax=Durusdinium trenchii TaxID=1381693 RepID=A0ABP0SAN8_9DINO
MAAVSPRLRELVKATAKKLNRDWAEAEPFLQNLSENWYDTVDSLKVVQVADLMALGMPQRFAKELLQLAQSDSQPSAPASEAREPEEPPPGSRKREREEEPEQSWKDRDSWKNSNSWKSSSWENDESGKGKGKGRSKGKGRANDYQDGKKWEDWKGGRGDDHRARDRNGRWDGGDRNDGGDRSERGGGYDPNLLPSQREFSLVHKITFDDNLDERFPLAARLIGKGGRNVKHICQETGAWVWVGGKGSGLKEKDGHEAEEPLHVLVKSDDQACLDEAVRSTNDLIDNVLEKYRVWLDTGSLPEEEEACYECGDVGHIAKFCPRRAHKGKGKSKGREPENNFNDKCFHCGGFGHQAKFCPRKDKDEQETCFECGETGHLRHFCPYRNGKGKGKKGDRKGGKRRWDDEYEQSSKWVQ